VAEADASVKPAGADGGFSVEDGGEAIVVEVGMGTTASVGRAHEAIRVIKNRHITRFIHLLLACLDGW
jgi:hypothetical protein